MRAATGPMPETAAGQVRCSAHRVGQALSITVRSTRGKQRGHKHPAQRGHGYRRAQWHRVLSAHADGSPTSAEEYALRLMALEAEEDWLAAVEVLTEIRILKLDVGREGLESAIRLLTNHGQWQRSVAVLRGLHSDSEDYVSGDTLETLFLGLSRERQGRAALDLLTDVQRAAAWPAYAPGVRAAVHNCAIRALAREALLEEALALWKATEETGLPLHKETYTALATAYLAAGDEVMAEQMLEERDYL